MQKSFLMLVFLLSSSGAAAQAGTEETKLIDPNSIVMGDYVHD